MPPFTIRRATIDDAEKMASLGARLFAQAYGETHPEPELSRYLARSFSIEGIREAIADDGVTMLMVEDREGGAIAYAYVRESPDPPPGVRGRSLRAPGAGHRLPPGRACAGESE